MALIMTIPVSATCTCSRNKTNSNNYQKASEASRKLSCFFHWKHEVLFNIAVQYIIVLDHFVSANSSTRMNVNKRSTFFSSKERMLTFEKVDLLLYA